MNPIDRNVTNLVASLSFYGHVEERADLILITAPVAFSVFNIAMLSRPLPDDGAFRERLRTAAQHYQGLRHSWSFWICEDFINGRTLRRLHDEAEAFGLVCIAEPPGMELDDLPPPTRPLPALEFKPINDSAMRATFARMANACFQIPPMVASAVYEDAERWKSPVRMWIGYHNGVAVTSAATVEGGGALGIYSVGTLAEWRGKGCAEAVMRHAVRRAREDGASGPLVLQSSHSGLPLYRALGFKKITRYSVFATQTSSL